MGELSFVKKKMKRESVVPKTQVPHARRGEIYGDDVLSILVLTGELMSDFVNAAQLRPALRADKRRLQLAYAHVFKPAQRPARLEQHAKVLQEPAHFLGAEAVEGQTGNDGVVSVPFPMFAHVALVDRDTVSHALERRLAPRHCF